MLLVGLTGGIGSGKTTVAAMLAARGAVVVDADELARRAIDSGTPGHDMVVIEFGPDVVGPDGALDRQALAARVFADPQARARLEAIVHPEVARLIHEAVDPYRETDRVVVLDVPLLFETGMQSMCDVVVVVTSTVEQQVGRLVAARGMAEEEIRARIGAQMPLEQKARRADLVVPNQGSRADLDRQVDRLWMELVELEGHRPVTRARR